MYIEDNKGKVSMNGKVEMSEGKVVGRESVYRESRVLSCVTE